MNEDQARALIHLAGPDGSGAGDFDATLSTVLRRGRRHRAVRRGLAISGSALATATLVLVPLFLRAQPAEHLGPAAPPLPTATSTTTPTVTGTTHTPPPPGTAPVSTTSHAPASPGFSPTDDGLSPTSTP
ncbi:MULTISPECIES: hypothetical protein [unclassified Amycolatopsis]|uniref:hypothetical protein n=1 Tax=unclassified Amycolatopsis TaxID=2618356 RepID=UPI001C6A093E|nr:hypothetical protein [Amycolatopsis sp. DSM 110486]QYN18489.1 hypothetical protein K1T34_37955 [Amycolatopsis sp. DSM 110486]